MSEPTDDNLVMPPGLTSDLLEQCFVRGYPLMQLVLRDPRPTIADLGRSLLESTFAHPVVITLDHSGRVGHGAPDDEDDEWVLHFIVEAMRVFYIDEDFPRSPPSRGAESLTTCAEARRRVYARGRLLTSPFARAQVPATVHLVHVDVRQPDAELYDETYLQLVDADEHRRNDDEPYRFDRVANPYRHIAGAVKD